MKPLILAGIMLVCPATKFKGLTKDSMTERDIAALVRASAQCQKLYKKSPCVVEFIKSSDGAYRVVCGKRVPSE